MGLLLALPSVDSGNYDVYRRIYDVACNTPGVKRVERKEAVGLEVEALDFEAGGAVMIRYVLWLAVAILASTCGVQRAVVPAAHSVSTQAR